MTNGCRLAIIIPAYKADFFEDTIKSLANQSCGMFNVYIGNDNGDSKIDLIVRKYKERLNITYKRFKENLGKIDLVAQWNRTIDMMGKEDFFILFSDDDVMERDCVKNFYDEISVNPDYDVYHFNINIIDKDANIIKQTKPFPKIISSKDYYINNNILMTITSRMPEFIFRTNSFRQKGGFVSFPLAMRTDNATVIKIADEKGICTMEGPRVLWRRSGINQAVSKGNRDKHLKLLEGETQFDNWLAPIFFDSLSKRLMWRRRFLLLKHFANPNLNVAIGDRKEIIIKSNDINNHHKLVCLITPLKAVLSFLLLFPTFLAHFQKNA